MRPLSYAAALLAFVLVACGTGSDHARTSTSTSPTSEAASTTTLALTTSSSALADATLGAPTRTSGCVVANHEEDHACTPGALLGQAHVGPIRSGVDPADPYDICATGYTATVRSVPDSEKNAVYAEYGITSHAPREYEVDHLVSLELGGSNEQGNLWPETYSEPDGARDKDKFENYLHRIVCHGELSLADAQHQIGTDWLGAWTAAGMPTG